jgi:hypothetical protein
MSDRHEPTADDGSQDVEINADVDVHTDVDVDANGVDPRRAVAGGLTVLGAIFGFTAARAAVGAGGLSEEWILAALPTFGIVGLVGFVVFLSAAVHD